MRFERAKPFSNGTEYEIFRYNYCEKGCIHLEDGIECARYNGELFPNVLVEVWDGDDCVKWHHCPFYAKEEEE